MSNAFDPLNLLILAVAVIVLWKLRSVLGTRTGHERRYDPYSAPEPSEKTVIDEKVIPIPGRKPAEPVRPMPSGSEGEPVWKGIAEEGSSLADGLNAIARADPS